MVQALYWICKISSAFHCLINLQSTASHQLLYNKVNAKEKKTNLISIHRFNFNTEIIQFGIFRQTCWNSFIMHWGFISLESNDQDLLNTCTINKCHLQKKFLMYHRLGLPGWLPNSLVSSIFFFKSHNDNEFGHSELWRCQSSAFISHERQDWLHPSFIIYNNRISCRTEH